MSSGTPTAELMLLEPRIQVKPVEAYALSSDGHLGNVGPHLGLEH